MRTWKVAVLAAVATIAMTGTAQADEPTPNGDESQSSTVTGDQLQGDSPRQLPGNTEINVPSPPPVITDGSVHKFDRDDAVAWALKDATAPQDFSAPCTWFVSRALWAGGIPRSHAWTDEGSHGFLQPRPGTASATAVEPLLDYLHETYPASKLTHLDPAINSVPKAELGDIFAYDWEGDGTWDHLALVTDIKPGQHPDVSEWGTADWPAVSVDYSQRGWTYSKKSDQWLQKSFPEMEVALLHIDTTLPNRY